MKLNRNRIVWGALAAAAVLTLAGFVGAFFFATPGPLSATLDSAKTVSIGGTDWTKYVDFGQKIFYFHVPVAITSFVVFFFTAFYGVRFLMTRDRKYDTRARIATEVTLLFVSLTMVTGVIWDRWAWSQWWVWEPRLTTYLIMMLLVIGYFVLRASVEDEEKQAVYAAVFGIIAFIDAPISFAITRIVPQGSENHPVVIGTQGGLGTNQLIPFMIAMFGMLAFGFVIYQLRLREERVKERLEALKVTLGD